MLKKEIRFKKTLEVLASAERLEKDGLIFKSCIAFFLSDVPNFQFHIGISSSINLKLMH